MPHAQTPSTSSLTYYETSGACEEPIPLASRIIHKFYEPVMLLVALIQVVISTAVPPPPEASIDLGNDKQVFCAFVNKLSHVCDSSRGGDTVTALMILQGKDKEKPLQYWFASNRRSATEAESVATFIGAILRNINNAPEDIVSQDLLRKQLLIDILRFNRSRFSYYLRELQSQSRECLERCSLQETREEGTLIAKEIVAISNVDNNGSFDSAPAKKYFRCCATVISLLVKLQSSQAGEIIKRRAQEGRMPGQRSIECWSDFLHTMKRILAYLQSIQFLFLARERFPKLFESPMINFVPSSDPIPKPIRNKSLTADGIVGRMTRKEKQIEIFRDFVRTLQAIDLDQRIKDEYQKDTFRPVVHAEVLLLNWLKYNGGIDSSRFFNGYMYIGGSKPMCKFCYYYFEEHHSGSSTPLQPNKANTSAPKLTVKANITVEHRACHGNIYPNWRVPDVFPSQGASALEARQIMVDRVLQRIRKEAFDIVRKRITPTYKEEDSNTFSASLTLQERWTIDGSSADVDDVASLMGRMDINESHERLDEVYASGED